MARDPLRLLQTLRQRDVDQARLELGVRLSQEAGAAERVANIDLAARRDRAAILPSEERMWFEDMFTRRSRARSEERLVAQTGLAAARTEADAARAKLVAARTSAEAIHTLLTRRSEAAVAEARRREQHVLDDMGRRPRDRRDIA